MVIPQTRVNVCVATALGVLSGYYIWNEPLKQYAEKNFTNKDLNKQTSHGETQIRHKPSN